MTDEWADVAIFPRAMTMLQPTRCPRTCAGAIYRYIEMLANRVRYIGCDHCGL